MSAYLSPIFNGQTFIPGGSVPASGYKLFTYAAGSSTKQTTYTDSAGTVPQSNPIILNAAGYATLGPIWQPAGLLCKYVLAGPNDTDPPTSPVKTIDNVSGVNDPATAASNQWQPSGLTPTYVSANTFTLLGDQTTNFHAGRRLQFTTAVGTAYGTIRSSAFGTLTTTVTMDMDGATVLDAGLTVANVAIIRSDNSPIGFYRAGTGAAARIAQDKMRDFVSVRDSSTTAVDGTTSNQADIVAAVADAFARGARLYWPVGTYVSTATIPNLHDVAHFGPGIIKRGSDLFYVEPRDTQTNHVYLATTGNNANDGLSASEPRLTFQGAFDVLENYGPTLDGLWEVIAAAGTYTISAGQQEHTTPSRNRVVVKGPAAGHPNVPTCIVDGGSAGADYTHGLAMKGPGVFCTVQDIKFTNFKGDSAGTTRGGLLFDDGADGYTNNVHADGSTWFGVYYSKRSVGRHQGGIVDACRNGILTDGAKLTVGYNATSLATSTIVKNCTESGVYWYRGTDGHCDYVNFQDNAAGLAISGNSRVDGIGCDFKRNTVGVIADSGGYWIDNPIALSTFNIGTADDNGTAIQYRANSGDMLELQNADSWARSAYDRTLRTLTGTVAQTVLTTPFTIKAGRLQGAGKSCRVVVYGVYTMTAGAVMTVNFGGMAQNITVPAAASVVAFIMDVTMHDVSGGYRSFGSLTQGLSQSRLGTAASGFDDAINQAVSVAVTLGNVADTINIYRTDVYMIG